MDRYKQLQTASVLSFKIDKNSKKWCQVLLKYLKKSQEPQNVVCFADLTSLTIGIQSKSKNSKVLLNIPSSGLSDYKFKESKSNSRVKGVTGFMFCLNSDWLKTFLSTIESFLLIYITQQKFVAYYSVDTFEYSMQIFLTIVPENCQTFQDMDVASYCSLKLNHQNNSILQSMDSICHNFKSKQVQVLFKSANNTLEFNLGNSVNNVVIGTNVKECDGYMTQSKRYQAKPFTHGFSNLQKADRLQLRFTKQFVIFQYVISSNLKFNYYLAELQSSDEQ